MAALGTLVAPAGDFAGLTHAFPRPERFDEKVLAKLGMPSARAATLARIAAAVQADPCLFQPKRDLSEAVSRLRELDGVGEWTSQYIAMRAMGETDALLAADVGLKRGLSRDGRRPKVSELIARAERWRPWRAYAAMLLWMADGDATQITSTKEKYNALTA